MKTKISSFTINFLFISFLGVVLVLLYGGITWLKHSPYTQFQYYKSNSSYQYYKRQVENFSIIKSNTVASSIPVLLYHGIMPQPDRFSMTSGVFEDQMFSLKQAGYQTITMTQFDDFMKGKISLPDKSFLLTFDDGRKDSYYGADPVLKAVGYNAVMFIATSKSLGENSAKSTYYLNPNELAEMEAGGRWEIQSHLVQQTGGFIQIDSEGTSGNFLSNKKYDTKEGRLENDAEYKARVKYEIDESKRSIEEGLHKHVVALAFPFGDFGQQTINNPFAQNIILDDVKNTYDLAFRQVWPKPGAGYGDSFSHNHPGDNMSLLRRIESGTLWTGAELVNVLNIGATKKLPYSTKDFSSNEEPWINAWGELSFSKDGSRMNTKASMTSEGSFVYLDGSSMWGDYFTTAHIDWRKGEFFSIISRFVDNDNYVSCTFNQNTVKIEQKINGKTTILANQKHNLVIPRINDFAMAVSGNLASCFVGNTQVVQETIRSNKGGVGGIAFKTWDSKRFRASVDILQVTANTYTALEKYLTSATVYEPNNNITQSIVSGSTKGGLGAKNSQDNSSVENLIVPIPLYGAEGNPTPYHASFVDMDGWKNVFGAITLKNSKLYFSANASTTSSLGVLQGSGQWIDYMFNTISDWHLGSSYTLVARYKDSKNYVGCSFAIYGTSVRLFQVLDGETITLGSSPRLSAVSLNPWEDNNLAIQVVGDEVKCYKDNEWILRANIDSLPLFGGVGIKTWDKTINHTNIGVKSVTVTPVQK